MALVTEMAGVLDKDRVTFNLARDYVHGDQTEPYASVKLSAQIENLRERSITNLMPLLLMPAQILSCNGYRRRAKADKGIDGFGIGEEVRPEYRIWQLNSMDARQFQVFQAALTYGQSFVVVNSLDKDNIRYEILPTRHTVAYFEDPANEAFRPSIVLTYKTQARDDKTPGLAVVYDETHRYELLVDMAGEFKLKGKPVLHGHNGCPVVRFPCLLDDEGRTSGVIIPAIPGQDRVNQAVFSTLITADFGAFKIRTISGMQLQFKTNAEGELILTPDGKPIPIEPTISQATMMVSADPDTKFDQLDETPLEGYLKAEEQAKQNLAATAQFPAHALMGSTIANVSAEALDALENNWQRFVNLLRRLWGEAIEQLMRITCEALGDEEGAQAFGSEVRWDNSRVESFPAKMDGLLKASQFKVPARWLWEQLPGVTDGDLADMERLYEEELEEMTNGLNAGPLATAARNAAQQPVHHTISHNQTQPIRGPQAPQIAGGSFQ